MYILIIIRIYIYNIYNESIKVKYTINRSRENGFRSDLFIQRKKQPLLKPITYHKLLFSVIYLYLVALLDFICSFFLFSGRWC